MSQRAVEFTVQGAWGMELFAQSWAPTGPCQGTVALVHGFGEHSDRYTYLVEALTSQGYSVGALDHRGHGRSPGLRGHVDRFDEYLTDVGALLAALRQQAPDQRLFLFGHSLGGLIALDYAIRHPAELAGVIASAPLLMPAKVSPLLLVAAKALSRIKPDFGLNTGLDAATISRDPAEVLRYRQDPMVHSQATARFVTELDQAITWTQAHAGDLRLPLFIYHGTGDRLVPIAGSRTFFANVASADKQWLELPDGYHESHNDVDRQVVLAAVVQWLDAHPLASPA